MLDKLMVKRGRNEILASILRSSARNKDGAKFTKVMYDSFLSYTQIIRYLKDLIDSGLIVNEPNITRYKITEKGLRYLELVDRMDKMLEIK
jgi:predicted transcriptional regulator